MDSLIRLVKTWNLINLLLTYIFSEFLTAFPKSRVFFLPSFETTELEKQGLKNMTDSLNHIHISLQKNKIHWEYMALIMHIYTKPVI